MSLLIKDQEAVFTPLNVPTGLGNTPTVTARPNVSPFSVLVSGSYVQDLSRLRTASMDPNRNWYLNLPWPSESLPSSVQWTILRSDGTALSGPVPEGVAGPVTVAQLLGTYGWSYTTLPAPGSASALSLTLTAPQEFTVTGSPSGPTGTIGLAWKNEAGNTFFAAPSGSTGVPGFRLLVPGDIPNLDTGKITSGTLALARLSGITASQLSASAGILGNQLSATAGIVHGQVASVDAATLLGTVPSANLALIASDIPALDAGKITTGTFSTGLLPIATAGALGAIKVGSGLSIASGVLSTVNSGTVTSVAMTVPADFGISGSAITSSGTLGLTWNAQTGNVVIASPSNGTSGAPTFRSLVSADIPNLDVAKITTGTFATSFIPNLDAAKITTGLLPTTRGGTGVNSGSPTNGQLLIGTGTGFVLSSLTAGSGLTITNSSGGITIAATGSGGTVTSVGLTAPSEITVTGTPITGAGTIGLTWASQSQNFIFAAPSGSDGIPGFRALAAADIPNIGASKITAGQLALSRGGTAVDGSSITANTVFAGPTSGIASSAGFRALISGDIPNLSAAILTSGTLDLARLSGITTTQLAAAAGILAGQLAVSNPTSGQIGGLTTSNLSASAGLLAAQIASVNPSTLTGSGTIPLAANTPAVAAGGLSTAYYLYT